METNPLNKLAHPSPSKDPAYEDREHSITNLDHPRQAWKNQKNFLDQLEERKNTMMNLDGHDVKPINSKNKMAQGTAEVFSKRAKELGIHNTNIPSEKSKNKKN